MDANGASVDVMDDGSRDAAVATKEAAADEAEAEEEEEEEEEQVKHVRELVRRKRRRARARLSGPAWEAGVKGAADWNANVLRDRYLRGPWYWDPNSRSAHLFREWSLARTPAMLQMDALAKYLLPLTPEQQSALIAAYTTGPIAPGTVGVTTTMSLPIQPAPSPSQSTGDTSARKPRGKRSRPKGPHCRMCLKEESAEGALMRCTECKDQYHPDCLELKKENIPKMMSFGWRCMHCKKCETCRDTGDEEKLLFCDACDRGFHTFCLSPPLKRPPTGGWFCRECVECKSCGSKTSGKAKNPVWHRGYTMCETCYRRFKHNKYCPICTLVYHEKEKLDPALLRTCVSCRRSVHARCDGNFAGVTSPYQCPPCRKKGVKLPIESDDEEEEDEDDDDEEEEEEEEKRKKARGKSSKSKEKEKAQTKQKQKNKKNKKAKEESEDEDEEDEDDDGDEDEEEAEEEEHKTRRKTSARSSAGDGRGKRKSSGGGEKEEERDVSPGRGERRSKRIRASLGE